MESEFRKGLIFSPSLSFFKSQCPVTQGSGPECHCARGRAGSNTEPKAGGRALNTAVLPTVSLAKPASSSSSSGTAFVHLLPYIKDNCPKYTSVLSPGHRPLLFLLPEMFSLSSLLLKLMLLELTPSRMFPLVPSQVEQAVGTHGSLFSPTEKETCHSVGALCWPHPHA